MEPNLGSGSALLGGGNDALQAAMQRRATGQGGQVQAQTPASAGYTPGLEQPALPSNTSLPPAGSSSASTGTLMGMSNTATENDLIIKALDSKLRSNASIEKQKAKGGF